MYGAFAESGKHKKWEKGRVFFLVLIKRSKCNDGWKERWKKFGPPTKAGITQMAQGDSKIAIFSLWLNFPVWGIRSAFPVLSGSLQRISRSPRNMLRDFDAVFSGVLAACFRGIRNA